MKSQNKPKSIAEDLGNALAGYYDRACRNMLSAPNPFFGKVVGYKKVKVPNYLKILIPVIERHYDEDGYEFEGWLVTFQKRRLFRIGTTTVEKPVYKKRKPKTITFKRYGDVAQAEEQ